MQLLQSKRSRRCTRRKYCPARTQRTDAGMTHTTKPQTQTRTSRTLYHSGLFWRLIKDSLWGIPLYRRANHTRSQKGHQPFVSRYSVKTGAGSSRCLLEPGTTSSAARSSQVGTSAAEADDDAFSSTRGGDVDASGRAVAGLRRVPATPPNRRPPVWSPLTTAPPTIPKADPRPSSSEEAAKTRRRSREENKQSIDRDEEGVEDGGSIVILAIILVAR